MNPVRYSVGQRVMVSTENLQTIHNSSRSIRAFPSDSFVKVVQSLVSKKVAGTVERLFLPGYEFNVKFDDGTILQMKDHWVSPLPEYDPLEVVQ